MNVFITSLVAVGVGVEVFTVRTAGVKVGVIFTGIVAVHLGVDV